MPDSVKDLSTPALRPVWSAAKKKATDEAKKLKQEKMFDLMDKKFKSDLGPDLEAWPKLYPNFSKLDAASTTIQSTIKSYQGFIKSSGLDPKVIKVFDDALSEVKSAMERRLKIAEILISSDVNLAVKDSKKKQTTPIIVFRQDIAGQVRSKSGDAAKILQIDKLEIEVILTDAAILEKVPNDLDDAVLANEIREAASFQRLVQDIATALGKSAKLVRRGQADLAPATKDFNTAVDTAIAAAIERAAVPIQKYTKVKTSVRNYKIKSGVTLGLTLLGAASGVLGLALAPLTLGVSSIAGFVAVAKSGVAIRKQIVDLSAEAEQVANGLAKQLVTLKSQYETATKNKVGAAELGKTLVNATMPVMITTIKGANDNCSLLEKKIESLKVKTHDVASNLGAQLTKQSEIQKNLRAFEKIAAPVLSSAELAFFGKLMGLIEKSTLSVTAGIESVDKLHGRFKKTETTHKALSTQLAVISSGEPTWAKVGEVIINLAASAGFLFSGKIDGADPYRVAELANEINERADQVLTSIDAAQTLAEGLVDFIEKKTK